MSLGDVLDGAFKLLKANARTILIVVTAIVLPLNLVSGFVLRGQFQYGLIDIATDPSLAEAVAEEQASGGQTAATLLTALLGIVATPFIAGAISRVVAASYLGRQIGPGEALKAAGRRFWALFASFVLVHLIEGVGFLLCILPGVALMGMYTLVAPAVVVEEIGPIKAMSRSWRLVRPRFWAVLGISLLAGIIASILGQILGVPPTFGALLIGGRFAWLLISAGGILASIVSAPIVAIVATLLYFDARIRFEGFDLQVIARSLHEGAD